MLWKIMILAGVFCFLYYFLICAMLKKWNSTFSVFWVFAGVLLIAAGRLNLIAARPCLFVFGVIFLAVECRILLGMIPCREKNIPYIIVLGAQVRGTRLSGTLYRRIEKARQYLEENPDTIVIVSGGRGKGEEITEAFAMERYLKENGIPGNRILREECSTTTEENFSFSLEYIPDRSLPIGIVTNNFHMYRACSYAQRLGIKNPKAVPAGCHPLLFPNYIVREFFALIKMSLKRTKSAVS